MLTHLDVRKRFAQFWETHGHKEVPPIPLVPQNDPTTLFTGSGMQQLVPNLLGEPHPLGTRLYNVQRCIRAQDIDEVGDNRHVTFFEMMGNWSLGDYFKKEQIDWLTTFLTQKLGLNSTRLYATIFKGYTHVPQDTEAEAIWKEQFNNLLTKDFYVIGVKEVTVNTSPESGIKESDRIFYYDVSKNWWSRAGAPDTMPMGEVGGPSSEVFVDFDPQGALGIHAQSRFAQSPCHPNCDCGRFIEIGNSVFMEYVKAEDGFFQPLPKTNVDFGGGLERILMAIQQKQDVFETDLFWPIVQTISSDYSHHDDERKKHTRIIADHMRTVTHLAADGIIPGPKEQGYLMRTLIRRAVRASHNLHMDVTQLDEAVRATQKIYAPVYEHVGAPRIPEIVMDEIRKYQNTLISGRKIIASFIKKKSHITGADVFNLYQSIGVPEGEVADIARSLGATVDMIGFEEAKRAHASSSKAGSEQKFKGGLADQSEQVVKYHTATHLLHQALGDVLGASVRQEGSNITGERLRFDFYCAHKPTPEELVQVANVINQKINDALAVRQIILPKEEAQRIGAKSFFKEKYPDMVKVFMIGASDETLQMLSSKPIITPRAPFAYSIEFCGGPHVSNTKDIGKLDLYKFEKIGTDLYRIYGK
ncbi:MAG TPA: alanine--tRNA ligase-related protein [Candidatus Woesebacteria bacterium]|nr:alanine--tRNA ligase-related protein [Candidatus Woesebacteria bacterium]HNS94628.1 alanine--tRNA ligase-related protein [Candidatus Woesebacteria bacterium]